MFYCWCYHWNRINLCDCYTRETCFIWNVLLQKKTLFFFLCQLICLIRVMCSDYLEFSRKNLGLMTTVPAYMADALLKWANRSVPTKMKQTKWWNADEDIRINQFFMIPVLSGIRDECLFVFFFQFCGPKEQYAIIFKCSLCNFTMAFDTRLDIIRPRIREFEWRDCGLSAVVGLKNRVCANFHELHSLFLRWPAYLLKMTTSISRFGQNVCSLATVKFQLEYEFMFDSFATIGSVKCIPKVAPLT